MMNRRLLLTAVAVLAMGAPRLLAAPAKMEPPGDCTKEKHRALQDEVNRACKGQKMKCTQNQDCVTLETNLMHFEDCIRARQAIMDQCFRGGDDDHRRELDRTREGYQRCKDLIECFC
jgi:hypothetical protein